MKKCPKCGAEVSETATVCPKCFSFIKLQKDKVNSIPANHKKCKICGTINDDLATFCVKCKSRLSSVETQRVNDSKTFICPKCLSFFGKKDVPKEMLKESFFSSFGNVILVSAILSIVGVFPLMSLWWSTLSSNARYEAYMTGGGYNGYSQIMSYMGNKDFAPALFFSYIVSFIILMIIFGIIYMNVSESEGQKKICPVCGRKGNFILSNSKLGMQYVNKKIIEEKTN